MNKHKSTSVKQLPDHVVRHTICGIIKGLDDHYVLKSSDVVVVTLCDITLLDWTRLDFPHIPQRIIVSNVKLDNCDYLPIPFTLYYNDEDVDESLLYGIRCDILDKDKQVKYSSGKFINVLTDRYPKTNIVITVVPYSDEPTTTATTTSNDDD